MSAKFLSLFLVLAYIPTATPVVAQDQKEVSQNIQPQAVGGSSQNFYMEIEPPHHDPAPAPAPVANKDAKEGTVEGDAQADDKNEAGAGMEIYGFAMADMIYDFQANNPDWFDVVRPTQLPSFPNQYGKNGNFYASVRQTRFGVKSNLPTPLGELKTIFEFDLFGVGTDAGQTTFHLRHAWGELGKFGAGQTWSPFMDIDVFPNSIEYWGPSGMVFFRNIQARYMPINHGNHQLWFALERPGASGDAGVLAGRIELQNIKPRFPSPDLSGRFRWGGERGYVQVAGMFRYIAWDDLAATATRDLSGETFGWGFNLSTNLPMGEKKAIKLAAVYGEGVENYMNDAPADVAPVADLRNTRRPVNGKALPMFGILAFYDHYWNAKFTSSIGYSMLKITNTLLQNPNDYHRGQYGLANLLYYPAKNIMVGSEFQWGRRDNFRPGSEANDYRIQTSFKYNFDFKLGSAK